jgi:uncharacterized phage protein gp47/JayE
MSTDVNFGSLIGIKSFDQLMIDYLNSLYQKKFPVTNLNDGGAFKTYSEADMQAIADLYQLLPEVAKQGFIMTATGDWLTLGARGLGLERFLKEKTSGYVTFGRTITGNAIPIPAGTIVKTLMSNSGIVYKYRTTVSGVLPSTQLEIKVPVEAETAGKSYNVGTGMITQLENHISGIEYITNDVNWLISEGRDDEDYEVLRQRCILRWNELSAGTIGAYESWGRRAGVANVSVISKPRGGGSVDVVIWGNGGFPTDKLIADVQTYIDQKRPITDDALVRGPLVIDVTVSMTVTVLSSTTDSEMSAIDTEIRTRYDSYFGTIKYQNITPIIIGQDLDRAYLIYLARGIEKTTNIQIITPENDISVSKGSRVRLASLNITVERGDD